MKGLYVHVPFCPKKCPYCDFYSLAYSKIAMDKYADETFHRIQNLQDEFDSLYFGGGTPSLLGVERANKLINVAKLAQNAEITLESNPNIDFTSWLGTKINRLSLGLQSANAEELQFLGRSHSTEQAVKSITTAKKIGIANISLDLMVGIKSQTKASLKKSIEFCATQNIQHISSYMLKIEEGTKYFLNRETLDLPDDDYTAELYLFMVEELAKHGFHQYEISNFAKEGFESRHNTKYWNCEEYEGLGPSAHSFLDGKRCYFPRDLDYYLNGGEKIFDSLGGDFEEFAMLKLRLNKGLSKKDCSNFPQEKFEQLLTKSKKIPKQLIVCKDENIHFTSEGFLLCNAILAKIL